MRFLSLSFALVAIFLVHCSTTAVVDSAIVAVGPASPAGPTTHAPATTTTAPTPTPSLSTANTLTIQYFNDNAATCGTADTPVSVTVNQYECFLIGQSITGCYQAWRNNRAGGNYYGKINNFPAVGGAFNVSIYFDSTCTNANFFKTIDFGFANNTCNKVGQTTNDGCSYSVKSFVNVAATPSPNSGAEDLLKMVNFYVLLVSLPLLFFF